MLVRVVQKETDLCIPQLYILQGWVILKNHLIKMLPIIIHLY